MRLTEVRMGKVLGRILTMPSPLNWARAVIRMLQVFGWLTLFGAFIASLGFTWFFGTVAVASAQGIHREVNLTGIAAASGILFVGTLAALFLFVVCAAATALVDLREQRHTEREEIVWTPPDSLPLSPKDEGHESEENTSNLPGYSRAPTP